MIDKNKANETATTASTEQATILVERAKGFWEKNGKLVTYGAGAVVIALLAYIGYTKFYLAPQEEKANEAIWHTQQYFAQDSMRLALEGDGQFPGAEKIAKTYSGTKAGNLAKFYAGVAALQTGDANKAVSYLKDFSTSAKEIQAIAYARLADAYGDLGKDADAITYYEKAGKHFPEQEALSSECLFRAGQKAEIMGKNDQAIGYYKLIKEKYPRTERGFQIDKYLARLGDIN